MKARLEGHPYFTLKRRLAVGGMGEVYLIESTGHPDLTDGFLVVKAPPSEMHIDDVLKTMLEEEGRLALRLFHNNIVETFAIEAKEDRQPMILMGYLHGPSLSEILGRAKKLNKKIPVPFILHVLRETACGLHFAHSLKNQYGHAIGLIHRDVSPANILITVHGDVKIIDFGIAKANDSQVKTKTGTLKGKLSYMSPEQITGKKPDTQADIWALGVVLWESLTVQRLFAGNTFQAVIQQVLHFPLAPPSTVHSQVSPEVDQLCLKLLQREKDERFQGCRELLDAISKIDFSWTKADTMALVQEYFPRRAERWLHEGKRLVKHRYREAPPIGLVDGGVFKALADDFDDEDTTHTSKVTPFDWSSFAADATSTKSQNDLSFLGGTGSANTFHSDSRLSNAESKDLEEENSTTLSFDADPWAELTITREIISPYATKSPNVELLDFEENDTVTRSENFNTLRSQESIESQEYMMNDDAHPPEDFPEESITETELVTHRARAARKLQPSVFKRYFFPLLSAIVIFCALAFYFFIN